MDKMKFETPDMAQMNVEKIAALFPNCVTESKGADGKLKKAVNFDVLKQMLGSDVAEGDESYEFTWVGKRDAMVEAAKPIRKTLRPCVEESVNFDTTENLYIEGDNLEALKLLQEGYLGKVKMIYIDPPYNTGNDFIYKDNFRMDSDKYAEESGAVDDEGNRMVQNSDSNGRFHSDWCSMIYSRLLLARNLLTDDGVIFISIDDNEQENLKIICNESFGERNFLANFIWEKRTSRENRKVFSVNHDYILAYAKNKDAFELVRGTLPYTDEIKKRYTNPDNDPRGPWQSVALSVQGGHGTKTQFYPIHTPAGRIVNPPSGLCWRYTEVKLKELIADNRIYFGADGNNVPRLKVFLSEMEQGITPHTLWTADEVGTNDSGKRELNILFEGMATFDTPKPASLIERFLEIANKSKDFIVMDFFSGSATTAHAVMQLNAEDGGHRKFIMVQLPEKCEESSEAAKAGYKTICEIGKERIRRAGAKILADQQAKQKTAEGKNDLFDSAEQQPTAKNLDIGFRVLKIDESNMKDVYYSAGEISQQDLIEQISNIKDGRTDLDLLFGCLVDWGVSLSLPIKTETIEGVKVHNVNDGNLVACFSEQIPEAAIRQIAAAKPLRAVFRDSSFASDSAKINVTEIFKTISPNTTVKVV